MEREQIKYLTLLRLGISEFEETGGGVKGTRTFYRRITAEIYGIRSSFLVDVTSLLK